MAARPLALHLLLALPVSRPVPRRHVARALVALVVLSLLAPVGVSALVYTPPELQAGTIEQPAGGDTVVGVQGFHYRGRGSTKKPARLVSIEGDGSFGWQFDGSRVGARWFYDVDPLQDGDLLVTSTNPDGTVLARIDATSREIVWTEELPYHDTHDVEFLGDRKLLIANMRQYDEETGVSNDRILVYDRHDDEVVWEWRFRDHYPNGTDGGFSEDWTHVNDVDEVGDGLYLTSPRNFDQVIVVNRSTDEIELRLGEDDARDVLFEQHNPDLIRGEDGSVSILVADSENDRVVEYERRCAGGETGIVEADPDECEWERTWELTGLNWPRDADRLPNGNTLVTDTLNHRVVEVTPDGRVVWEYYATWGPYDAERIGTGDESNGPPTNEVGGPATTRVSNSAGLTPGTGGERAFHQWLSDAFVGSPLSGPADEFAARWAHVTPWLTPNWMSGWDLALTVLAALVLLGWGGTETYIHRARLRARAGALVTRVRTAVRQRQG